MEKFVAAIQDVVKSLQNIEKAVSGTSDTVDKEIKQSQNEGNKKNWAKHTWAKETDYYLEINGIFL